MAKAAAPPSPSGSSSTSTSHDSTLEKDLEAVRRACLQVGTAGSSIPSSNFASVSTYDSDGGSTDSDVVGLLRRQQQRFGVLAGEGDSASGSESPLSARLPSPRAGDSDTEDDFEMIRAIQRKFARYESGAASGSESPEFTAPETGRRTPPAAVDSDEEDDFEMLRAIQRKFAEYERDTSWRSDSVETNLAEQKPDSEDHTKTETNHRNNQSTKFDQVVLARSNFPKSAQMLINALKKNRSCQKFVRRKMIEIDAKMEQNKELRDRIKCLMDFQVACKRKAGRILSQKRDPRVRLISVEKSKASRKDGKASRRISALYFGPTENPRVSNYRMVQKQFPVALKNPAWTNTEKENIFKGIKQQYQEMLIVSSINSHSDSEGLNRMDVMSAFSSSDFDATLEKIRSFLPLVNWDRLAFMYTPGRTGSECESRWINCGDPLINQNPWGPTEDKKLLYLVQERGVYNWINISVELGTNRTPFQCLARYQRSLNPLIMKKDWTEEDDVKLCAAVETFGDNNWQLVAFNLEGWTGQQCSNRWRKTLNPERQNVGRWSIEEDKRLKVAVTLFSTKHWDKISHFVPGRTQSQCRERWLNCLDPSLNLKPWTHEEDSKLLEAINLHGHCWSKIAICVPPRTDNQCRRRWKFLCPEELEQQQAARKIRRTVLITNFVDRKNERPTIGPNDFTPLLNFESEKTDKMKKSRKKSKANNSEKIVEENMMGDEQINSSIEEDLPEDSRSTEHRSFKRRKKSCSRESNEARANSDGSPEENSMEHPNALKSVTSSLPADNNGNNEHGSTTKANKTESRKLRISIGTSLRKREKKNLGWIHGEIIDGNSSHWRCKYCNKIYRGGGVCRLKMHIAGGYSDVADCTAVPLEVRETVINELGSIKAPKRKGKPREHNINKNKNKANQL